MDPNLNAASAGQLLLADFQTAITSIAMTQTAKYQAEQSENALMRELSVLGTTPYLNPGTMTSGQQTDITRGSLDAHIKKVQAKQLESLNAAQLQQLMQQDQATYRRRKISIVPLDRQRTVIESVWFDKHTGYRTGQVKRKKLIGNIEDVLLDQNVIIIKPTMRMQLVNPGLQNYVIHIIDLETLLPLVELTII